MSLNHTDKEYLISFEMYVRIHLSRLRSIHQKLPIKSGSFDWYKATIFLCMFYATQVLKKHTFTIHTLAVYAIIYH